MLKLLALVLFACSLQAQIFPVRAPRWFASTSAPSSGCASDADTDKVYIYKQAATTTDYRCRKTGASTFAWVDIATASGSGDVTGGTNLTGAGAIPYISASATLNQDTAITRVSAGIMSMNKIRTGTIYPASDSTTAVQINKADGTTNVLTVDTTNGSFGIGATPAASVMLDVTSLGTSKVARIGRSSVQYVEIGGNAGADWVKTSSSKPFDIGTAGATDIEFISSGSIRGVVKSGGSWGIGPSNTSPTGTLSVYDATASTGVTRNWTREGAGQSTSEAWGIYANDGTTQRIAYGNGLLTFGGTTSSFPALKRSTTTLQARLADDSGYAALDAGSFLLGGATKIVSGSGSPEGAVTAPVGSVYYRTDGAPGYEAYYKGSGSGNTGWSARGNGDYYLPVSFSATPTFLAVAGVGTTFEMTLTGNVTSSTLTGAETGKRITWRICQDGTGGYTFVFPTNTVGASTVDPTASACTMQEFVFDGTNAVAVAGATVVGGSGDNYILIPGSTSGSLTIKAPAVAGSSVLRFPNGSTDLSSTGPGYLKQASAGAALTVQQIYRVCDMAIGDTAGSALSNAQLGPQKRMCFIPQAATIFEVHVSADGGTPSVVVGKRSGGTATDIISGALATAASGGIACAKTSISQTCLDGTTSSSSITVSSTSLAAGDYLELVSGTAGGTAKLMTVHVVYTVN